MQTTRDDILRMTESATAVAVSVVLGNLRLLELPNGGSITLAAIPLLAFAMVRGVRAGVLTCLCAGFAHAAMGGTIIHPVQLLLDYGIAYAVLGIAGAARSLDGVGIRIAIVAAAALQLAATTVSGVVFFGDALGTTAAWRYSVVYNAATIVPELLLALVLVPGAVRAICRADPARAWRAGLASAPQVVARTPRFHVAAAARPSTSAPAPHHLRVEVHPALGAFVRAAPFSARPLPSSRS